MIYHYRAGFYALIFFLSISWGCNSKSDNMDNEREQLFNNGWKFIRDSIGGAEQLVFNDSAWLEVDLPHDFSLMDIDGEDAADQIGPFSKKSPGNGNSTGHFLGGTGWYRKTFSIDKKDEGKTVILKFEGVYMESEVWVNGHKAGIHKNGYTPFWINITPFLNTAEESNVVAVKVENIGRNSRWYSGSGIYRNVYLQVTDPVHVGVWGTKITTPEINHNEAVVEAEITVQNDNETEINAEIIINIKNSDGNIVGTTTGSIIIPSKSEEVSKNQINVESPVLWSLDSPNLYTAEVVVKVGDEVKDIYDQTFGIRNLEFSADKGFLLNGESVLLKGACIHHDNGLLGAAAFERAEERKVEVLKANGFNAIRCAHNPFSDAFYKACDKHGMLVISEFTDIWENYKNPQDYSQFFKDYWQKDVTNWMMHDRNHPSIIMWSIGNEIFEPEDSTRLRIGTQLAKRVRELDDTRAVTMGVTGFFYPKGWESTTPMFDLLDVCGYNYMIDEVEYDHQKFPERIIYMSESYATSAYDYWKTVEKHPYVIGDFIWTAWDYLGEVSIGKPNYVPESQGVGFSGNFSGFKLPEGVNIFDLQAMRPSNWPYFLANCGDIDISGEKTPQMLYRDVIWGNSNLEINVHEPIPEGMIETAGAWSWPMEFPHWNWPGSEGKVLHVRVFTRASQVKLELKGKWFAEKELTEADKYIATFEVPYQPGELKATCYENGVEVESKILKTAKEPKTIRLTAEQSKLKADRKEVVFVKVEVMDESGQLVPTNDVTIELSISGNGEIIASGNASPNDMESFNSTVLKTYQGKAQVVIRPFATAGEIILKAHSQNLTDEELKIVSE
ncbi:glycoside hydrolase family 2 TIM barrel-domain containing protein [Draconibacterium mangrovi]|uniref:glycoside hydrolase family 2 TIM barrel-domain containing protein n=1 Tax=Draconibacterium mangrovi TaxID=2697469 RepID=UPI0013D63B31|nr:glycoside hydrolase family 2 TIM barrel-domain containing protein [Draconibacterium mangrovi]